jgi:dienelactone hydrolase
MTKYTAVNINTNDIVSRKYVDNAVLYLPKTYTPLGQATKIVIYCKHGQSVVEPSHDEVFVSTTVSHYFLSLGYAILAADGLPNDWATLLGLCERVVGNYVAVQSMKKAYDIATNLFNLDKTGCFVYGFSQGGHYAQNVVDMSGIPVCAVAEMSPARSYQFHQWDLTTTVNIGGVTFTKGGRINVARIFGYPAVSNNTQLLALQYDEKKQQGYDPYLRNVVNPYKGFIQNGNLWVLPEGTTIEDITDMKKYLKAPLKVWCCTGDTALSDDVTQVFIKAARNAGQVAEIQVYEGGDHNVELAQDSIGSFIDDGVTYQLKPIMKEIAIWFSQFGGINV